MAVSSYDHDITRDFWLSQADNCRSSWYSLWKLVGFPEMEAGRGSKTKLVQQVRDADSGGVVILNIDGDQNNIQLTNNVYKLAENKKVLESAE